MKKISLLFLAAATAFLGLASETSTTDPEMEEGVLVLNDKNFDEVLAKHDYLMVEFYAPWCGHCKALAPEYAKAAQNLASRDPPYYLAKVDAIESAKLAEKYEVQGFPTLIFFKYGSKQTYTGGRTESEIVEWYLKKTSPPSTQVACDELKAKVENTTLAVAYFGDTTLSQFSEVFNIASHDPSVADRFSFYNLNDQVCAKSFGLTSLPGFVLFRKFEEPAIVYDGEMTSKNLISWISRSSFPLVILFNETYIQPIFQNNQTALFLFRDNEQNQSDYVQVFHDAAKALKNEGILFAESDIEDGIQARLAEFLGTNEAKLPQIRLLNPGNAMRKYEYQGDAKKITVQSITNFLKAFKEGQLKSYYKSQRVPEDNSKPLKTIVGSTYKEIIFDNDNDVFVKYYAPWCGHCQQMAKTWIDLADHVKDVPGLVIAEMDSTENEAEDLDVPGFPTIKLYIKGKKNESVEYEGDREIFNFKEYLWENSPAYRAYFPEKPTLPPVAEPFHTPQPIPTEGEPTLLEEL